MLKRLVVAAIGVVGLLVAGLGVASATLWRADDVLVASLSSDLPYVATAPGVIDLAGAPATVTARTADGHPVVVAVGRDSDVVGWLGQDQFTYVTGLSSWHSFAGRTGLPTPAPSASGSSSAAPSDGASASLPAAAPTQASAAPTPTTAAGPVAVADPSGSDMWVAQDRGQGAATVSWPSQPGRWSVLAASPDGTSVTLSIAWPRTVTTPYLWPGVIGGGLLVLLALALAGRMWWSARRASDDWTEVESPTGAEPLSAAVPKTRRELREAERLAAAARSGGPRTGAMRRVPSASDAPAGSATGSHPTVAPAAATAAPAPRGNGSTGAGPGPADSSESVALPGPAAGGAATSSAHVDPAPASEPSSPWRAAGVGPAGRWRPAGPAVSADPTRPAGGPSEPTSPPADHAAAGRHGGSPSWAPRRPATSGPEPTCAAAPSTPPNPSAPASRGAPPASDASSAPPAPGTPPRRARPSWLGADRGRAPEPTPAADPAPGTPPAGTPAGRAWPTPAQPASPVLPPTVRADAWRRTWGIPAADDAPKAPDSPAPEQPEEGR